jgi:MoxR-like ATPase
MANPNETMDVAAFESLAAAQKEVGDGALSSPDTLIFPYFNIVSRDVSFAVAHRMAVTTPSGSHNVVVSYREENGEERVNVWCGDRYLEGALSEDDARQRCKDATNGMPGATALAAEMLRSGYRAVPASTGCNFWTLKQQGKVCKHVKTAFAHLDANRDIVHDLRDRYKQAVAGGVGGSGAPSAKGAYELEDLAFRVPVLYEGERGGGKTREARMFARQHAYPLVECPGNEGYEAPDLLGYLVPYGPQAMVWKDGPIAEAFRKATKGKTVLLLDELLRIRVRELSLLLTALSPDEGVYRLRTGRIVDVEDGIGQEEVLEVPVSNLCIIATTNVGAEYAVDDIDPALAERFVVIRKDTTEAVLKKALQGLAKTRKLSSNVVTQAMEFFKNMTAAHKQGLVHRKPTTRTMTRAFELATEGTDTDVKRGIESQILLWVARDGDGHAIEAQVKAVKNLITRAFI